ncbi:chemerin-like receptor 2 [Petromyzon marinus]|uniref:G-protein coupled receptor 1-like n=2 Tax=Petromyzon marinus TaxID=7757 RepID=A0AAJ7WMP6_PETMA|nr:G-protein coupled receptor 1-like [Petromyzon marinus]
MATITPHLPSSSSYPTAQSNKAPVWNSTTWVSSQTTLAWLTNITDDEAPKTSNDTVKYASIIVFTVVFVLGSVGNFLVIWILGFKMKRTMVTLFFLHLSIADFILVMQIPVVIAHGAMNWHWAMGTAMCKLISFGTFVNMNASVYFLTLISLDRYAALVHPVSSLPLRRLRLARWLCLAVWLLALLLSLPSLIFRTTIEDSGFVFCYNDYGESFEEQTWNITAVNVCRVVLGFAVPYAVMIFCYCCIGARLRHVDKSRRGNSFRIIVVVVVAFFVCWAPYHAIGLLETASYVHNNDTMYETSQKAMPVIAGLVYINSCINPILYVFSGSHLKAQFRRSLVAAIENAFRDQEPLDSGQESGSGPTAQSRDATNLSSNLSSNTTSGNTSGHLQGSHGDVATVGVVQEAQV